ncbi:hydroxypyruvate isomerase family protein [Allonocardiopsis opalescens]|uniref:Hydroxypyruvate isomerase n=1 Tax=Allonocardiopsis opalescens TaxID=1144618 RepID=A0A2T0PS42_9ACTN|nr:TIM barrel protein [Allonocardiopsis opalescens]PRX91720.1 hydroxypyruvate isomerase [Allonocardiopsis opalescens]
MSLSDLKYDVNLSIVFTELPLLERPAAAAAAGFDAVELWWPFDTNPVPDDQDVDALVKALESAGTQLVGLNFIAGDMPGGDRGWLSRPADSAGFLANIEATVALAERTGTRVLNALYGNRVPGVPAREQEDLAVDNLAIAARAAARIGATVVVEALNSYESPDYPIVSTEAALALIDRVRTEGGVDNVAFLADLYHLGRMGEDLHQVIAEHADRFGHVQIADIPGRGQPGTGELDFTGLLGALAASPYQGHVGLEYKPQGPSAASFTGLPGHS